MARAKVVVVGDMRIGTNSRSMYDGFADSGLAEARFIDTSHLQSPRKGSSKWIDLKLRGKIGQQERAWLQRRLNEETARRPIDLLLAIKTIQLPQQLLLSAPAEVRAHLSFDDVSNPDNLTSDYLLHERAWDAIVTTKRHNLGELDARGARNPLFIWGAYDPKYRRFERAFVSRKFDVGFIGAARPDRISLPTELARHVAGSSVIVGPRWRRAYPLGQRSVRLLRAAYGEKHNAIANDIRLGLLLLNSENRDQHTNRTFEMPATGQLVLGQRTPEHEELFDDGVDARLFDTTEQMWEEIKIFSRDLARATRMAEAGHRRITEGGNTYRDRAISLLKYFQLAR